MKKIEINFNTILLIIAIALFLFFRKDPGQGGSGSGRDTILNQIIYVYDSSRKEIPKATNYYSFTIKTEASEIPAIIDSAEVIADYYRKRVDIDIRRDSNIEATIQDTIFQNARIGRMFSYKLLRPLAEHQTIVIEENRSPRFYLGGFAGNDMHLFTAGISSSLIAGQRENLYGIDYNFTGAFPYNIRLRFQKLISFRKRNPPRK